MFVPDKVRNLLRWAILAFVLHGLWEIGHLPLYTLWDDPDRTRIVLYVLHCIVGDVLIATTAFIITIVLKRDWNWPVRQPWFGGAIMITLGLTFTVFSEWYNVYQLGAWSYTSTMPLVFGIGISPLLQWLLVPVVMMVLIRRGAKKRGGAYAPPVR